MQVRLALLQSFARTKHDTWCSCRQVTSQGFKASVGRVPIKSQTFISVTEIWFKFESQGSGSVPYNFKHSDLLCCAAGWILLLVGWFKKFYIKHKQHRASLICGWVYEQTCCHWCMAAQNHRDWRQIYTPFSVVQNDLQFSQMNDFQEKEEIKCFQSLLSRGFYTADFSLLGLTITRCFMCSLALRELKVSADMKY